MKKTLIAILLILSFINIKAADKEIKSTIEGITVFQKGAQIYRTGSVILRKGVTNILLTDLSKNINQQSIQVKGYGDFTILSVNYQLNYLKSQRKSKEVITLEDSLKLLKYKEKEILNKINIYKSEETVLMANKSIGGNNTGVNIEALKSTMNYFHSKLNEIKAQELKLSEKLTELKQDITRIENQLNNLLAKKNEPVSEVVVKVLANKQLQASFDLKYVIYDAGWIPEYDLRATDISRPVVMSYKAKIFQTSGEDWNDVKLTVSTGNPQLSGKKPELYPWHVNFYNPPQLMHRSARPMAKREMAFSEVVDDKAVSLSAPEADYGNFETTTNQTNVQFNVDIPYTIPANGKSYAVQIDRFNLNADYIYYAVPKLQETAFLLARVTGWEQYNLLPGTANIFFEGTYVGNSSISPQNTEDTMNLSLGRDESIVINREKIKDFESQRLIGMNKKETFGYEIKIRNNKKSNISIMIEDQFPVSSNKDIEIEQIEKSGARLDAASGKLTWKMELNPSETRELEIKYSLKYPKDRQIDI